VLSPLLLAALLQAAPDPQDFWTRDSLLGDPSGVRADLADRGLSWTLAYTGEVISNVSGGLQKDVGVDHLLDWVIDADFQKMLGWTGGSARLNPLWIAGDGIAKDVGDLTQVSNISASGGTRIFEAWLQQNFGDHALSIRAGIMGADQEFAISPSSLLLFNSSFGAPIFVTANVRWPVYPVGGLGARVRCEPGGGLYLMGGVYDGNADLADVNRTGVRIKLQHGDGQFAIGGAGWNFDEDLPGVVKLGGFYHSADFTQFSTGKTVSGLGGAYAVFDKRLYKEGPLPGTLDYHFRVGFAQQDRSFVHFSMSTGVKSTGLIPGRPLDVAGLGWIYARISPYYADAQPQPEPWSYESVLEATYQFFVTPAWSLQPDVQYVMHPGGSTLIRNATVLGLRVDITF
jgi:porin